MLSPVMKRKNWYWKREDWSHVVGLNGTWVHLFHEYIKSHLESIYNDFNGNLIYRSRPVLSRIIMMYRICRTYNLKIYIPLEYINYPIGNGRVELYNEIQETEIIQFIPEKFISEDYPFFPIKAELSSLWDDVISVISKEVENLPNDLDNLIIPGNGLLVKTIFYGLAQYNKHPKHIIIYTLDYRDHHLMEYAQTLGLTKSIFIYSLDQMKMERFQNVSDPDIMVNLDEPLEKKAFIMFNARYNKEIEKNNCFWVTETLRHLQYLVEWREFDPILYGTDAELEAAEKAYLNDPKKEGVPYGNSGSVCTGSIDVSKSIDDSNYRN